MDSLSADPWMISTARAKGSRPQCDVQLVRAAEPGGVGHSPWLLNRVEAAGTPFGTSSRPGAVPLVGHPGSMDRHTTVTGCSPLSSGQPVHYGVAPS